MNLSLDLSIAKKYRSSSQIARIVTEYWVESNSYCPSCGNNHLTKFDNNKPVADCKSEYELKSKKGEFTLRILDGAYDTMIKRINSDNNPNFLFLNYSPINFQVENFLVIPKYFFYNDIIQKRKPLSLTAKRSGWIGCNILLQNLPSHGKIFLIRNRKIVDKNDVLSKWSKTSFLSRVKTENKGWTLEILKIIEKFSENNFSLKEIYNYEEYLRSKFPNNNFIKDKIRQQLQILRDKNIIKFLGNGIYQKI